MNASNMFPFPWQPAGFAPLFGRLDASHSASYPPYDIEADGDDAYIITMALPGFGEDELEVSVQENRLRVSGQLRERQGDEQPAAGRRFLSRGIAARAFEQAFQLAEHVEVQEVRLENGMLSIALQRRVPEPLQRRVLPIRSAQPARVAVAESESPEAETPQAV